MDLDHDACYRAVQTRDARFDGRFFGAVRTTGIYCRPVCPATTPKRQNMVFYRTAAAAEEAAGVEELVDVAGGLERPGVGGVREEAHRLQVRAALQRRKNGNGPVSAELLTHFLVSTYISVLSWWLSAKNPIPPKDINEAYRQLVLPSLASIFD